MPLHIAIDVRRIRDFGIGTYIRNLIRGLSAIDAANRYTLIAPRHDLPTSPGFPITSVPRSGRDDAPAHTASATHGSCAAWARTSFISR